MLTKVGVTDVKKPIRIVRGGKTSTLFANINVYVNLPAAQKGSHLSRNLEIISEAVEKSMNFPIDGIETMAAEICRALRKRHEYSTYAEVNMTADYFAERSGPSGKKSLEAYKIMAKSVSRNDDDLKKMIGVQVIGMTACPCAMETVREMYGNKVAFEGDLPVITHNQRNIATVMIEVPERCCVEANDLIDLVEDSFSSPTFELFKTR